MLISPKYSIRAFGVARRNPLTAFATAGNNPASNNPTSSITAWFSSNPPSKKQRPIFVAATKQHVGKTSTSLALLSGLQKRFDKVGFIKPVGQQHVPVYSKTLNKEICV
jgi:Mrp family chromosome partitioning ATPase